MNLFHWSQQDGAFLVRDCSMITDSEPLVLCVYHEKRVFNVKIRYIETTNKYALGTQQHSNNVRGADSVQPALPFVISCCCGSLPFCSSDFWLRGRYHQVPLHLPHHAGQRENRNREQVSRELSADVCRGEKGCWPAAAVTHDHLLNPTWVLACGPVSVQIKKDDCFEKLCYFLSTWKLN